MEDNSLNFDSPAPGSNAILEQPPLPAESTSPPSQGATGQAPRAEGIYHHTLALRVSSDG